VVWEDFTYPSVACFGGIVTIDLTKNRRLDILPVVTRKYFEARTAVVVE
jgi:hypothetical protein